jgi:predicted SAM-dependent methyltransferase
MQFGGAATFAPTREAKASNSEIDHIATSRVTAALLQSLYDLVGELRGIGPTAHELLHQPGELSLRRRMECILSAVEELHADLAEVRGPILHKQLQALGIDDRSRNLQIHIGCGGHHLPGWVNLDNYPAPLATNLACGLPLPDCSARYVFLSHLLEHLFYPAESHRLLDEIRRVLQPGGIVRIVVPDIEQCINAYIDNNAAFFFARREHRNNVPDDATRLEHFLAYAGAGPTPQHLFEHHKFGYDFETLRRCLERSGFTDVRRCDFQQSPHAALRVDHASSNAAAKNVDRHYSLFVEARAPEKN